MQESVECILRPCHVKKIMHGSLYACMHTGCKSVCVVCFDHYLYMCSYFFAIMLNFMSWYIGPAQLALKAQLVVLVSAFVMVITVWSVYCNCLLFFYSRCPRAQPFVKVGGGTCPLCPTESAPLTLSLHWRSYYYFHFLYAILTFGKNGVANCRSRLRVCGFLVKAISALERHR